VNRLVTELAAAFGLLTRLPIGRLLSGTAPNHADCVWAYPVVGLAVSALGGAAFYAADALGMPASLAAVWSLAALVLSTGGLHEDGLADTADGFGGGSTRERKLEILRDSRIGSYGAIALILSLGLRAAAIAAIATPHAAMTAMVVAGALGRAAMIGLLLALKPARPDGMAASLGYIPHAPAFAGLAIALLTTMVLLAPHGSMIAIVLAFAGTSAMAVLAWRQIRGYTGDVLGATEITVECLVLTALAI
jgi:adenosylcobinamide-GDP ribazoletransferase